MGGFTPAPRTEPTLHSGLRDSYNISGRVVDDVFPEVLLWRPSAAPLVVLTNEIMKSREVGHYEFAQFEKDEYPRNAAVVGAVTSGATTVNVSTGQGTRFAAGYMVINTRSREVFRVSSISTDALTVVRSIGGVADTMVDGDALYILGSAYEDGATKGTFKGVTEDRKFNYTQIIRRPYGTTRRMAHTKMHGGSDWELERKWQGVEFAKDTENFYLFGRRGTAVGSNSRLITYMGGLEYFITSNVWDLNGNLPSESQIVRYMETAMVYGRGGVDGTKTKYLLASARWISVIEGLVRDRVEYTTASKSVGLKIGRFETSHGTIMLINHPLLVGPHADMAFFLDLNHIRSVHFADGKPKRVRDIQDPSLDGKEEEWLADVGIQVDFEAAHGIWRGLPLA